MAETTTEKAPATEAVEDMAGRQIEVYDQASSGPMAPVRGAPLVTFTDEQREIIRQQIAPDATDTELAFVLAYARRVGLDPIARQMYAIPRLVNRKIIDGAGNERWMKERRLTIQTSIDGLRLVAQRTGDYAGRRGPEWCGPDGRWLDVWLNESPPAASRVGVLRHGFVEPLYAVAHWREYVPGQGQDQMWKKMPAGQLGKCAEALALRSAFPAELSGLYTDDEMAQANHAERRDTDPTGGSGYGTSIVREPVRVEGPAAVVQQRNLERPTTRQQALAMLEGVGVQFPNEWIKEALTVKYGEVPESFTKLRPEQQKWVDALLFDLIDWFDAHYAEIDTPVGAFATVDQIRQAFFDTADGMHVEGPMEKMAEQAEETANEIFAKQVEWGLRNEDGTFTEKGQMEYGVDEQGDPIVSSDEDAAVEGEIVSDGDPDDPERYEG